MALPTKEQLQQQIQKSVQVARQNVQNIQMPKVSAPTTSSGISMPSIRTPNPATPTFNSVKAAMAGGSSTPAKPFNFGLYNSAQQLQTDVKNEQDTLNNPLLGFFAKLGGVDQDLATKQAVLAKYKAGQPLDFYGDYLGPKISQGINNTGQNLIMPARLLNLISPEAGREAGAAGAQFLNPITLGLLKRIPGYAENNTPQTTIGKIAGGVAEAAGYIPTFAALAPATAGIGESAAVAASKVPAIGGFLSRLAPMATQAGIIGALQDPGGEGLAGFLDPAARLRNGLVGAGTAGVSTAVGGVVGKGAQALGASDFIRKIAQGIGGGTIQAAIPLAAGERDPAKLATQFGLGFGFGASGGDQAIHETFGGNSESMLTNPRDIIAKAKESVGSPTAADKFMADVLPGVKKDLNVSDVNTDYKAEPSATDKFVTNYQNKFKPIMDLGTEGLVSTKQYLGSTGQAEARASRGLEPIFKENGINTSNRKEVEADLALRRNLAIQDSYNNQISKASSAIERISSFDISTLEKLKADGNTSEINDYINKTLFDGFSIDNPTKVANKIINGEQVAPQDLGVELKKGASNIFYPKEGIFGKEELVPVPEGAPNPKYDKFNYQLQEHQKSLLDFAHENGVIPSEIYNKIAKTGDYVPFNRYIDEQTGGEGGKSGQVGSVSSQKIVQKFKGSDKPILSPIDSINEKTIQIQELVNRNNVAKSIVESAQQIPALKDIVQPIKDTKGLRPDEFISVSTKDGYQTYRVPEDLGKAAKNLPAKQMSTLIRALSVASRLLRQGATSANISFMIPNLARDQFSGAINDQYGYKPLLGYASGLKSLFTKDESYLGLLESGGKVDFGTTGSSITESLLPRGPESSFSKAIRVISNPAKILETIGNYSEMPTRIGLYKNAIAKGATPEQAMLTARGSTADFAIRGADPTMQDIVSIVPFLNARIQGFDSLVQSFKNDPVKASLHTALYAVLPTVVIDGILRQTPIYNQLSDYDKDKYYLIPLKGTASSGPDDFVKIPKPEIAWILNPFRKALDLQNNGQDVNPNAFLAELAGNVLPISPVQGDTKQGSGGGFNGVRENLSAYLPQAIKPLAEVITNYDTFRQRPIVSSSKQNLPAAYQYSGSTDPFFIQAGESLGVSPAQLQQVAYGYGAGVAQQVASIVGRVTGANDKYAKEANPGQTSFAGVPVIGRFLGTNLQTPDEQLSNNKYAIDDLRAKISATRNSKMIPPAQKTRYIQDLTKQLAQLGDQSNKLIKQNK